MMVWMMLLLKGLKREKNKFMLVNMGAGTNVVCTLKKEAGDSEEPGEI